MTLEEISEESGVSVVFVGAVVAAMEKLHEDRDWADCTAESEGQTCCIHKIKDE
jgi:hypothetical protein